MLNLNKTSLILAVSLSGALASALPSQAQSSTTQTTFASITGITAGSSTASNVFTYTPGTGGGITISPNAVFAAQYILSPFQVNAPANLSFTGLNNIGAVTTVDGKTFSQALSGGTFSVTSGGASLLSGAFNDGVLLNGTTGSSTSAITDVLNDVVFTGGTYFNQSKLYNPGSFSISMTSVNPVVGISGGYFNGFNAGGTGTFSATSAPPAVPEPATVVPFLLGGLSLLALAVRKNRRSSVTA